VVKPVDGTAEGTIAPSMFTGKTTDNQGDWLRQFENYTVCKGLTDVQQCNFLRVLVSGLAGFYSGKFSANSHMGYYADSRTRYSYGS